MFRCLYIILSEILRMYVKVTKLIKESIYTSDCHKIILWIQVIKCVGFFEILKMLVGQI